MSRLSSSSHVNLVSMMRDCLPFWVIWDTPEDQRLCANPPVSVLLSTRSCLTCKHSSVALTVWDTHLDASVTRALFWMKCVQSVAIFNKLRWSQNHLNVNTSDISFLGSSLQIAPYVSYFGLSAGNSGTCLKILNPPLSFWKLITPDTSRI